MMRNFVMQRLRAFSFDRAKTDRDSTSNMSPHIHWGEISARQVYYVVKLRCPDQLALATDLLMSLLTMILRALCNVDVLQSVWHATHTTDQPNPLLNWAFCCSRVYG